MSNALLCQATPAECPPPGVYRGVADEEYRSWAAVTQSSLKQLRQSPYHYKQWRDGNLRFDSKSMELGRIVHDLCLEPSKASKYRVATQRRTEKYVAEAAADGAVVVAPGDWITASNIATRIMAYEPFAVNFTTEANSEVSIVWKDAKTGLPCKGRLDHWNPGVGLFMDIKTTSSDASPEKFAYTVKDFGYREQAAWYTRGLAEHGYLSSGNLYIAAETKQPHSVQGYSVLFGGKLHDELDARMAQLTECLENDSWPGYADGVVTI